jgi:hypothetical protein
LLVRWENEKQGADIEEAADIEQQRAATFAGGRPTTNVRRPDMAVDTASAMLWRSRRSSRGMSK